MDISRSHLLFAHFRSTFCVKAIIASIYLINRIPSKETSGISPHGKLLGVKPDYFPLKVFGCTFFMLLNNTPRFKLSAQSTLCVFLGYGDFKKGYQWILMHKYYMYLVMC